MLALDKGWSLQEMRMVTLAEANQLEEEIKIELQNLFNTHLIEPPAITMDEMMSNIHWTMHQVNWIIYKFIAGNQDD